VPVGAPGRWREAIEVYLDLGLRRGVVDWYAKAEMITAKMITAAGRRGGNPLVLAPLHDPHASPSNI